ncbi:MAG: RnfABCDGE type electron transport complex subunit D [Clostridia bacterium]|nr:RnfABCDGE type electron transport complex subunit D [Clostridia bacterium]
MKFFSEISFMKQKLMTKVIYSLIPLILASVYFFGWRSLVLLIWVSALGIIVEWLFQRKSSKKVSQAVLVTSILYTLTLPPSTPFWVAGLGIIFGIIFGKEVFGGFGRNVFNPALVARAFVYVCFPKYLTLQWSSASNSLLGGFGVYLTEPIDVLSHSTPMLIFRESGAMASYFDLLWGNVSGSLGETSGILIIISAVYLIYTKTASFETIIGMTVGFTGLSSILHFSGISQVPNPLFGILSGGFLFGAVFMATDPISSPRTKEGRWIYGVIIGIVAVIIRGFALFAGGVMFAILIGNTFAPIIDESVKHYKKYKKNRERRVAHG